MNLILEYEEFDVSVEVIISYSCSSFVHPLITEYWIHRNSEFGFDFKSWFDCLNFAVLEVIIQWPLNFWILILDSCKWGFFVDDFTEFWWPQILIFSFCAFNSILTFQKQPNSSSIQKLMLLLHLLISAWWSPQRLNYFRLSFPNQSLN